MRILGVDGDREHRQFFVESAERDGHEAVVADSGLEAWDLIQAGGHFDLIVSAYLTGSIDGLDLLKKVRENPATATTPFVMYTGWRSQELTAEVEALEGVFELKAPGRLYPHIFADHLPKQ